MALARAVGDALVVGEEALAVRRRIGSRGRVGKVGSRDHGDAIHGAGRDAELAAGAECRDDDVHLLARADDRVDGAGRQAFCAADA